LHVKQVVNTENLQHSMPYKPGLFHVCNCEYPAKGEDKNNNDDDDDDNNNNNNNTLILIKSLFPIDMLTID
jgi:hypothetical protein